MQRGCTSSGGGEPGGGDGGGIFSSSGSTRSLSSKSISCIQIEPFIVSTEISTQNVLTGNFNLSIKRFFPVALSVRFRRSFLRILEAVILAGERSASAPEEDDSSPGATPSANITDFLATL